ncbi:MAG TPA: hypothetical protein PKA00_17135 [Saprospiraceae bacterium]|nr:hypothetical protein [Saprospiraceae bacterium]HMQ84644.1 hypothetical protein [Saprospiraceae bacterium]
MDQLNFTGKHKTVLIGFMILGLVCMGLTFAFDDELHTRFWSNYLHNSVFFTGIAFISVFVLAAFITALAGWHVIFKRVWEAYAQFLLVGLGLMLLVIIGIWGHFHHLYHWADKEAVAADPILSGKSSFLNPVWYTLGTILILGTWAFFAWKLRQLSLDEDKNGTADFDHHRRMRIWAAAFLPIAGFTSAAMVWQWVMSVDAHWYSTLFAWYTTASWFLSAVSLTILTLVFLKSQGYLEKVTFDHLHDLGKYMFAFSIFWTYLWFSQYMLIWYGNVGEETVYYRHRLDHYPVLFYGNLLLNFVAPFFILMRNDNKRKYGTLVFTSVIVFFGHWWDFFQMIKPGVRITAMEALAHHASGHGEHAEHATEAAHHAVDFAMGFSIPGLLEIGTMLGFLALFLYFVLNRMSKVPFTAKNDPYWEETTHHVVEIHDVEQVLGHH